MEILTEEPHERDGWIKVLYAPNRKWIGDYVCEVDGDWYFWPHRDGQGYWAGYVLEAIAGRLRELNGENEVSIWAYPSSDATQSTQC